MRARSSNNSPLITGYLQEWQLSLLASLFHGTVEQYSSLNLTKPTDRLPALSGIAKGLQHLRSHYFAGLWSDSLCFNLMWRVNIINIDGTSGGRLPGYHGPSWSWISVTSPVCYWSDIQDFDGKSIHRNNNQFNRGYGIRNAIQPLGCNPWWVHVRVDLPGYNPFGTVTSAGMIAKASSKTAKLIYTYTSYSHGIIGASRKIGTYDHTRYKLEVIGRDSTVEVPFFADYALGLEGPGHVPERSEVTLFLVHPCISLVLRRKYDSVGWPASNEEEMGTRLDEIWARIGIIRVSENMMSYADGDLMWNHSVAGFCIA
jgi:hypothetical protein